MHGTVRVLQYALPRLPKVLLFRYTYLNPILPDLQANLP